MDPLDQVAEEIQVQLRKARLLEQRGDAQAAEAVRKEIVEAHPDHPEAILIKAEGLEARGDVKAARDTLGELIAAGKANIEIERKHAALVLKVAERDMLLNAAMSDGFGAMMNPQGVKRSSGAAAFFSMLMPGFGQLYNGQLVKGIVYAVVVVLLWIVLLKLGVGTKNVTEWFWPSIGGLALVYIASIIDAAVGAGRSAPAERPARPVPPVDKPFE